MLAAQSGHVEVGWMEQEVILNGENLGMAQKKRVYLKIWSPKNPVDYHPFPMNIGFLSHSWRPAKHQKGPKVACPLVPQ